jgi:hypothetical protein
MPYAGKPSKSPKAASVVGRRKGNSATDAKLKKLAKPGQNALLVRENPV